MITGVTGASSTIITSYLEYMDDPEQFIHTSRDPFTLPWDCDRYILCAGVLHGKSLRELSRAQVNETMAVNFTDVARFCDVIFEHNKRAKICVIGSESGVNGSYNMAYAGAKAALHKYVETKILLTRDQHLVCVSPTIIQNSGMTRRRKDSEEIFEKGKDRRLGRWLSSDEVARTIAFALAEPALSNTIIHMTGGNW